ncbi:condensation domain-containing protein [Streptomyces sp. NPDC047014]|uniref:condensation domain-containing protein n=1 Tax=Streptomyces sp. NPDC047014 TaxID=3155736 RepID=UPI0033F8BDBF
MADTLAMTAVLTPGPPTSLDLHGRLTPAALTAALALLPPCTPTLHRHTAHHHTLTLPPPPFPAGRLCDLLTGTPAAGHPPAPAPSFLTAPAPAPEPDGPPPLPHPRRELLLDALTHPGAALHIEQLHWRWHGPLDTRRFTAAWQTLYDTEAVLRTALARPPAPGTGPHLTVHPHATPQLQRHPRGSADWHALLLSERMREFDLHRPGTALRIALLEENGPTHRVLLTYHQALLDGWSARLLRRTLHRAYLADGRPAGSERRPDIRDHLRWTALQDTAPARAYWARTAAPADAARLPGPPHPPHPAPGHPPRGHGRNRQRLTPYEALRLRTWAASRGAAESTALHAVWALQLHRATPDAPAVTFTTTVSGRGIPLPGAERLPGPLRNTLPLHTPITPTTPLTHLLTTLTTQTLQSSPYEWLPSSPPAPAPGTEPHPHTDAGAASSPDPRVDLGADTAPGASAAPAPAPSNEPRPGPASAPGTAPGPGPHPALGAEPCSHTDAAAAGSPDPRTDGGAATAPESGAGYGVEAAPCPGPNSTPGPDLPSGTAPGPGPGPAATPAPAPSNEPSPGPASAPGTAPGPGTHTASGAESCPRTDAAAAGSPDPRTDRGAATAPESGARHGAEITPCPGPDSAPGPGLDLPSGPGPGPATTPAPAPSNEPSPGPASAPGTAPGPGPHPALGAEPCSRTDLGAASSPDPRTDLGAATAPESGAGHGAETTPCPGPGSAPGLDLPPGSAPSPGAHPSPGSRPCPGPGPHCANAPATAPGQGPGTGPALASGTPGEGPGTGPARIGGAESAPGEDLHGAPGEGSGTGPARIGGADSAPGQGPHRAPGQAPGTGSRRAGGTDATHGEGPHGAPGQDPHEAPGQDPYGAPGEAPHEAARQAPGTASHRASGHAPRQATGPASHRAPGPAPRQGARPETLVGFEALAPLGPADDPVHAELAAEGIRVDPAEAIAAHTPLLYTLTAHHDTEGGLVLTAVHDRTRITDTDAAETLAQTALLLRALPDTAGHDATVAQALALLAALPVPRTIRPTPATTTARTLRILRAATRTGTGTICLLPPPGAPPGCYDALADAYPGPQALATVPPPADARSVLAALRPALARGEPLLLGGFSGAGSLACEVAERIAAHGWYPPRVAIAGTLTAPRGGPDPVRALARTLRTAAATTARP